MMSSLHLPLPESSLIKLKVVVQLLPIEIKYILENDDHINSEFQERMEMQRSRGTFNFDIHETSLSLKRDP